MNRIKNIFATKISRAFGHDRFTYIRNLHSDFAISSRIQFSRKFHEDKTLAKFSNLENSTFFKPCHEIVVLISYEQCHTLNVCARAQLNRGARWHWVPCFFRSDRHLLPPYVISASSEGSSQTALMRGLD